MNILYLFSEDRWMEHIKKQLHEHSCSFALSMDKAAEHFETADVLSVFVNHEVRRDHIEAMPNLKLIATRSTGYDHIDMEAARERGVTVATVPSYGEHTVAEYTFALLLALSRKIFESYEQVREQGSFSNDGLRGFDLNEKTIGVIGTGKIGRNVIRIAQGFSMNVLAYDVFPDNDAAMHMGFSYTDFDDLLGRSDIISLHAPYNEHTHHMINEENVRHIKHGSYLVNTARGGLVQTSALVRALSEGIISGAALDVLEEEGVCGDELQLLESPHPSAEELRVVLSNHFLIDHPRVIITPHNAFNTEEAIMRIVDTTVANIRSFAQGTATNTIT